MTPDEIAAFVATMTAPARLPIGAVRIMSTAAGLAFVEGAIRRRHCLRCGYDWYPRTPAKPARCANPRCRSPYWAVDVPA